MAHIFKPGDVVFSIFHGWIVLELNKEARVYKLAYKYATFTEEGKYREDDPYPILLDYNPYDPSDPNNPPEFKNDWPFMLRGRKLKVGMQMYGKFDGGTFPIRIESLDLRESNYCVICSSLEHVMSIHQTNLLFPDEISVKNKVALWAFHDSYSEDKTIRFSKKKVTEEVAKRTWGKDVVMVPGTEEEVI